MQISWLGVQSQDHMPSRGWTVHRIGEMALAKTPKITYDNTLITSNFYGFDTFNQESVSHDPHTNHPTNLTSVDDRLRY